MVFNYESFRDYRQTAQGLAAALEIFTGIGSRPLVLVGHSMGGLVARAATQLLEAGGRPGTPSAIIALGSPHLGTPLPTFSLANAWSGIPTAGGQSLTSTLERIEAAALYLFGGDLVLPDPVVDAAYSFTFLVLCIEYG
jgi:hypothetical protein